MNIAFRTKGILNISRVDIYSGWCKKCGICVEFCPENALGLGEDNYPFLKYPERCTGCGWCEARCPDFAIVVSADEEAKKG